MSKLLNSFRFQISIAVGSIVAIIIVLLVGGNSAINQIIEQQILLDYARQQSAEVFRLAELTRRLDDANNAQDSESILGLIQAGVANFDMTQSVIRNGNAQLGVIGIQDALVIPILDSMDDAWAVYRDLLLQYNADQTNDLDALLDRTANQAVTVFTYADRLTQAIQFNVNTIHDQVQVTTIVVSIVTALLVIISVLVTFSLIRSLNALTETARALQQGDFKVKANTDTNTEVSQVGNAFNSMSEHIQSLIHNLEVQVAKAESAQQQAEQASRVKSSFLASMSHELRTPLNSIINFSKFIAKGVMGPVNEEQEETLNEVVTSGEHLLSLINDVLDVSKIESGSLNLFIEDDVNLNTILTTAVSTAQSLIADKPVVLETNIQDNLPPIRADRQRILQVLLNVLSNACKFTDEGHIRVSTDIVDDDALISIQDTGSGIADNDHNNVFESFKQTESGLRAGSGTGLGMPISRSLVEAHGGKLWFESEWKIGSTFYISLPVKSDELVPTI